MKTQVMMMKLMSKWTLFLILVSNIYAFEIDSKCKGGRLALIYREGKDSQQKPQIWF